jgi:hypothetical protein
VSALIVVSTDTRGRTWQRAAPVHHVEGKSERTHVAFASMSAHGSPRRATSSGTVAMVVVVGIRIGQLSPGQRGSGTRGGQMFAEPGERSGASLMQLLR